ncbi:MAG: DUF1566 domain-containing protein [bacterium]|nr:DUF1566 domain-containing protein [bacterium]
MYGVTRRFDSRRVFALLGLSLWLAGCTAPNSSVVGDTAAGGDAADGSGAGEVGDTGGEGDTDDSGGTVGGDLETVWTVNDTGQTLCFDDVAEITCPAEDEAFFGQDGQYDGVQMAFRDNGDGTVTDLNTGLMWQQTPDLDDKSTFAEAVADADTFELAGYDDWRLPTIKELYSLIDFNGSSYSLIPYIDSEYLDFRFGDESLGERVIDAQYWSATEYVGTTMNDDPTVFGVNFADGRIKGYPRDTGPDGTPATQFVRYVRDNPGYGVNDFVDKGDGTITDRATGLMWQQSDSAGTHNWQEALDYAENLTLADYDDWRLPNAKELQSIVDYTRAPDASDPTRQGPAIDPIFGMTDDDAWYWTGTTHLDVPEPDFAVYVCFGLAWGWMQQPPDSGNYVRLNVHGAGAQRSDPKDGDPADFPTGHGPQGDEIRILNYARCVRGPDESSG